MRSAIPVIFSLLVVTGPVQANYEIDNSFRITDGTGGSFTASKTGSLDSLEQSTGNFQSTGTFSTFALLRTNPVILVNGPISATVTETPDHKSVVLFGTVTLSIGPIIYPVVFDNLIVSTSPAGVTISGTVTVAGFPIAIPKGHVAETIVVSVAELLD